MSIGRDSVWVFATALAARPEVQALRLFYCAPSPLLQYRSLLTAAELSVVERGLRHREALQIPFWDAILTSCFREPEPVDGIILAATHHNPSPRDFVRIERGDATPERLRGLWATSSGPGYLAASSLVEMADGSSAHLPLLDFHIPPSIGALRIVRSVLKRIGAGTGAILESGKSYHFIGQDPFPERELTRFLARALLFAPIIDRAWVAHQLLESACALRVSPKAVGEVPPFVVEWIE